MLICINLETFHILPITYLTYTITGASESSSFEIQVPRMELFLTDFKSGFLTSFFPKGDFLYQILSPGFYSCLKVKENEDSGSFNSAGWRFFNNFVVFNRTAFMVNCLRSGIKHSSSRKLVQAVTIFGCSLCFRRKDFIALFRIVFPMKCRPTEDVEMYFWLETKIQGKQPPGNTLLVFGH